MTKFLVTGAAGFIGFHVCRALLARGETVIGIDNLNDYYDVQLKRDRLSLLEPEAKFTFQLCDLADESAMRDLFGGHPFDAVIHLGAQAGVRYSLENPSAYIQSNVVGFANILEGCRHSSTVKHLTYASSSSVYGANREIPFSVSHNVDHPISLYAATKKSNELMAHTYSHLYGLPTTGLRFFTVYGPWGRPDMAAYLFTKAIINGDPIKVFNHGNMQRDFTYIDDIVEGVIRTSDHIPQPSNDGETTNAPYKVYNIGNHQPVELSRFIEIVEECAGKKAVKKLLPMQPGDVPTTYADTDDLRKDVGFAPSTPLEEGLAKFVEWYREYHGC